MSNHEVTITLKDDSVQENINRINEFLFDSLIKLLLDKRIITKYDVENMTTAVSNIYSNHFKNLLENGATEDSLKEVKEELNERISAINRIKDIESNYYNSDSE